MDNSLLSSTAYFPPVAWYVVATKQGGWWWEAHENYQKGGYRNRCRIATANGPRWLTVPLEKGKNQGAPIQEVTISYQQDWPREHIQSIRSAYGRAPYFEFYAPPLFALLSTPTRHLCSLNQKISEFLDKHLQLPVHWESTDSFISPLPHSSIIDVRGNRAQLPVKAPPYPQLFSDRYGFQGDLAILDLLFCLGPAAGSYLRGTSV
ncbi:MAG: WbqC family protein [Bacteroidota bacterium]